MEVRDSYHILIYGAEYHDDIKIKSPFKEYSVENDTVKFIGFQFDRIEGLFRDYISSLDLLLLSGAEPSTYIKNLWNEYYPEIEAKCYALLKVWCSCNSANGVIAYGYWINANEGDTIEALYDNANQENGDMKLCYIDHCQSENTPGFLFYGKTLCTLTHNDTHSDCEDLAMAIMTPYKSCKIPSRSKCIGDLVDLLELTDPKLISLSDNAEITVLCNICYCCS